MPANDAALHHRPRHEKTIDPASRLPDRDRSTWDQTLIEEGQAPVRACLRRGTPCSYQIHAAHSDAARAAGTS